MKRGVTLLEVLIASAVMLIIVGAVFFLYVTGTRAWLVGRGQADLLQELLVVQGQVERDVSSSIYASLSIGPGNASFSVLSGQLPAGDYQVSNGVVEWQKYLVFYLDPEKQVRRLEVPLVATAPQRISAQPIDSYDDGSGPRPISAYLSGGKILGRHVANLTVTCSPVTRVVSVTIEGSKKRADSSGLTQRLTLPTAVKFPY